MGAGIFSPHLPSDDSNGPVAQMPFADDVRHYTFPSLSTLTSRSGERMTRHAYLPTEEQLEAMDKFVDAMDLTDAGEEEEDG